MATITTILATDIIAASRVTLNTNFSNLNTDKVDINSTYADPAWITSLAATKLTGTLPNANTTATASNTASAIVARDASGNFTAGTITGNLTGNVSGTSGSTTGNAATATALQTARTIAGVSFNGTANIAIPSSGLSDSSDIVRGASSVASGQVLYGTAAGVAGTSANLLFSNTSSRLTVGNSLAADNAGILTQCSGTIRWQATPGGGGAFVIQNNSNTGIFFNNSSSALAVLANTGNLLLGTTTDDGTNRLQVAGSARITGTNYQFFGDDGTVAIRSSNATGGTLQLFSASQAMLTISNAGTITGYNPTPTTGVTQLIVRAGAGQSTTNLQTWQSAAGTALAGISGLGSFFTGNNANATGDSLIDANGLRFGSTVLVRWSNNLPVNAADFSLSRAGINIGQFGDGGSNSNGLIYLKGVRPVGSTVANLPTASGNTGMMATVTDATVTTVGTTVAGGGANTVLVWSNGTNWRIYAN